MIQQSMVGSVRNLSAFSAHKISGQVSLFRGEFKTETNVYE
jgi:hypothetical protein